MSRAEQSRAEQSRAEQDLFWHKKAIISYCLSILVFWIHCSAFANYDIKGTWANYISIFFQSIITPIAVPLFFIISGAMLFRDYSDAKYLVKMKNRVYSLLIPFILWNTINMIFEMVSTRFLSQYFTGREVFELSIGNVIEGVFHYKYNGPFWFVFALIIFSLLAPVIDRIICKRWIGVISIVLVAVGTQFGIGLPTPLFYSQTCIVYYLVGAYIGKFCFERFADVNIEYKKMIICAVGVLSCYVYSAACHFSYLHRIALVNECFLIIGSLSIWGVFNLICTKIKKRSFIQHSFWVYALHINVGAVVTKLIWMVFPKSAAISVVNFVLTTIITLVLIEFLCLAVKRIYNPLYAMLSGNR